MHRDFEKGEILLIDKPLQWTSFDVVRKIRNALKIKKIGHAGTLDPLATGLLILCTGKMTKRIEEFQSMPKTYTGRMLLGKTTPSVDLETEFDDVEYETAHISETLLAETAEKFQGTLMQTPPLYSAVKLGGKRAFEFARKGETREIQPKQITIESFKITQFNFPEIAFEVTCSKGTYIRSLVRDFGTALGSGACLTELRRTRIGSFSAADAESPENLIRSLKNSHAST